MHITAFPNLQKEVKKKQIILFVFLKFTPNLGLQFWKSSYDIGGSRYSLLEIEHCVLRAEMPIPDEYGKKKKTISFSIDFFFL